MVFKHHTRHPCHPINTHNDKFLLLGYENNRVEHPLYRGASSTDTIQYNAMYQTIKRYLKELDLDALTAVCHLARKLGARRLDIAK